jgi:hypothetical protein
MKQTAVEWLEKEFVKLESTIGVHGVMYELIEQAKEDDTSKVTRLEVIDTNGIVYQKWNCNVELSYQDDDRTLKVFIKPINKQDNDNI